VPSVVHFQEMESSVSGCRCTCWSLIQSETNSSICTVVVIFPLRDLIQVLLVSSCATELFFLLTRSKRCGARLHGASPSSQLWCQNLALVPLPIDTEVEAWNNKRSMSLHGTWSPTQGFEPSVHSCHSQRSLSARLNLSRSGTPRPPKFFGLLTLDVVTNHITFFLSLL